MDMQDLQGQALSQIAAAADLAALDAVRVQYLGGKGQITGMLKELGGLDPEARKVRGAEVNAVRAAVQEAFNAKKDMLETAEMDAQLAAEAVDVTLPADFAGFAALGAGQGVGRIHPLTAAMEDIARVMKSMGFVHGVGPELETDDYNFTKLNLPPEHPARQDQDTFYLKPDADGVRKVLRTQTSNVQIHTLEKHNPPLRVMGIGRVYRRDYDLTHTPQFHQVEGLLVDKGVTMGDMRGVLAEFYRSFFGKDVKTRMRPHYFPFTEPSAELDMECIFCKGSGCRVCKQSGWLEILGCGMVHRNVLAVGGLDIGDYQGFAFGAGVERLAMLKYGIGDLRLFYESHASFLRNFGKMAVAAA
ncbi:MAG: phenylalanine--tRNA ligase subunit alpha [Pseudomonadaceae bacterium]|nr:phenylalanine--tRNA ligase subunit alpha [Pseudomonadaceae bacterium]